MNTAQILFPNCCKSWLAINGQSEGLPYTGSSWGGGCAHKIVINGNYIYSVYSRKLASSPEMHVHLGEWLVDLLGEWLVWPRYMQMGHRMATGQNDDPKIGWSTPEKKDAPYLIHRSEVTSLCLPETNLTFLDTKHQGFFVGANQNQTCLWFSSELGWSIRFAAVVCQDETFTPD